MNPATRWDIVPVYGVYLTAPGDAPVSGTVEFKLSQRITRTDGRTIYPDGAKVTVTIGSSDQQDTAVRVAVRAAWRDADEAAMGEDFDGAVWDQWWDDVILPAAIFTGFPAADDPDIEQQDWQVTVSEKLHSGGGKQYAIQPLLTHLELPIPGINLGVVDVPPGSPTVPAPVYMKGIAGGLAALDADGDVVNADGEKVTGGGSYIGSSDDITEGTTKLFVTPTEKAKLDDLKTVATSGSYNDLTGKPFIPSSAADVSAVPTTRTVAGKSLSSNVTLVKGDVGLDNVDNTADASKPVSTAQAAEILKVNPWANGVRPVIKYTGTEWPTRSSALPYAGFPYPVDWDAEDLLIDVIGYPPTAADDDGVFHGGWSTP